MAFDENLAMDIRAALAGQDGITEKKMFGGLSFLLKGNMACGVIADELIVRVGPDATDEALAQPHTRAFDFTGTPMKGWVVVGAGGYEKDADLKRWVQQGVDFASSLPPK
ncbi:MAG: TfoX/Sxy family protein [Anaerolineales bacterium]|nr:TfoX/Sxy family protein [Anaerolineales bacterium]